jgi:hypothetical protein
MNRKPRSATHKADVKDQVHGEGNYQATRDYNAGVKEHLETHDVEQEARDAAPRSANEEREMKEAEREGASRAKGKPAPDGVVDDLAKTE